MSNAVNDHIREKSPGSASDEHRAFEHLFRQYYPELYQCAYALLQKQDLAEEVVHEVFIKYWKHQKEIQIRSSLRAYLQTITRNLAIDRLRSISRNRLKSHALEGDYTTDYAQPHDILIGQETQHLIEAAIEALPPQGKLIFRMSREHEMSYSEIAKLLGLSIKTIEAHMGRSLKCLRKRLQHTLMQG